MVRAVVESLRYHHLQVRVISMGIKVLATICSLIDNIQDFYDALGPTSQPVLTEIVASFNAPELKRVFVNVNTVTKQHNGYFTAIYHGRFERFDLFVKFI